MATEISGISFTPEGIMKKSKEYGWMICVTTGDDQAFMCLSAQAAEAKEAKIRRCLQGNI
ncbi:hypothetical protein AL049_13780 [Pseudomonas syringae pv. cerasicola]|uniref:hypothetical protein n=1 Tax=Pseudomonas syringae TaxID=317 RepID=UPI0007607EDD|nr:hypothetical protein [Pseudomonas syringae]KWS96925.1 hypothetical protein AL049_13780 [Pseudomonas syringae pv. cerasicola]PHN67976.1 hypothetical protein AO272_17390 [Pseudomonas syringae pv. cerasicola]PHN82878.1 hypothetical protein AO252_10015 [Pseudomonas syringae pv. cerasicola]